jgi:hypothetical protein
MTTSVTGTGEREAASARTPDSSSPLPLKRLGRDGRLYPNRRRQTLCRCGCGLQVQERYGTVVPGKWKFYRPGHKDDPRRMVPDNERAFAEFTPESAYWVGFLMADGYIATPRVGTPSVVLSLSVRDVAHLESLKRFLGARNQITHSPPATVVRFGGRTSIDAGHARFSVRSRQMVADLARWGVVPGKSLREAAHPILSGNRDFWRGVVDGDGCLRWLVVRGRKYPSLGLVGSGAMVEAFHRFIVGCCWSTKVRTQQDRRTPGLWSLILGGQPAKATAVVLYTGASVALPRKALMASEFAAWVCPRLPRGGPAAVYQPRSGMGR